MPTEPEDVMGDEGDHCVQTIAGCSVTRAKHSRRGGERPEGEVDRPGGGQQPRSAVPGRHAVDTVLTTSSVGRRRGAPFLRARAVVHGDHGEHEQRDGDEGDP